MDKIRIKTKVLSANSSFYGKKTKTQARRKYEYVLFLLLPNHDYEFTKASRIRFTGCFGITGNQDLDNCLKILLDVLQKKYKFNDRQIHEIHITKQVVKKGSEFLEFSLEKF